MTKSGYAGLCDLFLEYASSVTGTIDTAVRGVVLTRLAKSDSMLIANAADSAFCDTIMRITRSNNNVTAGRPFVQF